MTTAAVAAPQLAYVRGVEAALPPGEQVLWQSSPNAGAVARHVFHSRKLAWYFVLVGAWALVSATQGSAPLATASSSLLWLAVSAGVAIGFVSLVARMTASATTYAITDRRVVMRIGIALPVVLNIPLRLIDQVDVRQRPDGSGELALRLGGGVRVAYLVLWPHARPWRLRHPEPLLRGLRDAEAAGAILTTALHTQLQTTASDVPANNAQEHAA